jgi:hypothetical protein
MAWEMAPVISDIDVSYELFDEDKPRYEEAEEQVRREVRENYRAEGEIGPESVWWTRPEGAVPFLAMPETGYPWPVNTIPYRYRMSESVPGPDDDIAFGVTEKAINVFEQVEPGVNRYLPIEIYEPDGSFRERRWLVNWRSRLDTIAPEHSPDIRVFQHKQYKKVFNQYRSDFRHNLQVAVWRSKIQHRSFWIEYKWMGGRRLLSDRLHEAVLSAGIRGWRVHENMRILEV